MADETPQTTGAPGSAPQPQPQVPQAPQDAPQAGTPVPPAPQGAAATSGPAVPVPTGAQGGATAPAPQQPATGAQASSAASGSYVGPTSVSKSKKPLFKQTILIIVAVAVAIVCLIAGGFVGSSRENSRIRNLSDDDLKSEFGYVRQENVPSNSNSTKGKTNSKKNSGSGSTGTELTGDVSSDWQDCEFSIDGHKFKLGESTLGDLMSQAGWEFEDAGYDDGYVVNPDQTLTGITLKNDDYSYVYITLAVTNDSKDQMDIKDCKLSGFSASYSTNSKQSPTIVLAGEITLGKTSYDDAKAAISNTPSSENSGSGYQSMTFTSRDYTASLSLSFLDHNNNVLSSVTMNKRI